MWNCRAVLKWSLLLGLTGSVAPPLRANPGHEVTVVELTAQIAVTPLPELYFQRAWNYREMQRLPEARADWQKTLELSPGFLPASRELARAEADEGRPEEGIALLRQAMAAAPADQAFHRPGCYSVLAELHLKMGKNAEALQEARAGLEAAPDFQLDLCLLRSEAQRRLGKLDERVEDLAGAMKKLRSFVVKTKWYDAMIDAGRGAEVLPEIGQEIENTRYHAAWRIRRARIRLHGGDAAGASADLTAALEEITTRLRPENPDVSLICDRGLILALQGDRPGAAEAMTQARSLGADFWMTLPLEAVLEPKPSIPSPKPSLKPSTAGNSGLQNNK